MSLYFILPYPSFGSGKRHTHTHTSTGNYQNIVQCIMAEAVALNIPYMSVPAIRYVLYAKMKEGRTKNDYTKSNHIIQCLCMLDECLCILFDPMHLLIVEKDTHGDTPNHGSLSKGTLKYFTMVIRQMKFCLTYYKYLCQNIMT